MAHLRGNGRFAKALAKAMKRAGKSQDDVARHAGVKRATVRGWLHGSEPLDHNFRKLVELFPELSAFA